MITVTALRADITNPAKSNRAAKGGHVTRMTGMSTLLEIKANRNFLTLNRH